MPTAEYIQRYGRDGKLFCRKCKKPGIKPQAVFLAHYVSATIIIHNRDGSRQG